jgi:NAD(P)-dependent dehydrogenase (short-subunit alcohol dehydrogenase family)
MEVTNCCNVCRTEEAVLEVYKTNMLGPLLTTQAFLPLLQKGGKKQVGVGPALVLLMLRSCTAAVLEGADARMHAHGMQVINISSGGGSLGRAKEDLGKAAEESMLLPLAMAYKASKAALNMRALPLWPPSLLMQSSVSPAPASACSLVTLLHAVHGQTLLLTCGCTVACQAMKRRKER